MHMQMRHLLMAMRPDIGQEPPAGCIHPGQPGSPANCAHKGGLFCCAGPVGKIIPINKSAFRDHQQMHRGLWVNIAKAERMLAFIQLVTRYLTAQDTGKNI